MRALILAPFSDRGLERMRGLGDVAYESWLDTDRIYDPDELGERCASDNIDVLVVEADFVFEEVIEAAAELRLVAVCRNALNHVDIESASQHGVIVTHARGRNTNAVAEMTLALMFSLARQIPRAHSMVSGGGWRDPASAYRIMRGREIAGSTVGIVGFGQIGREVARKCIALGAAVIVHDPLVAPDEISRLGATPADLAALVSKSDFVSLHVPLAEETSKLIDATLVDSMRPAAFLINTSAGAVIDQVALIDALHGGRIAGAALDVFEGQPLPLSSPLLGAPNVILTPHIGGATAETIERQSDIVASEVERLLAGEPLQYAVNAAQVTARAG